MIENLEGFTGWLKSKGAEIRQPTNEWEVLRYKLDKAVRIIYQNKKGNLSWVNGTDKDYKAFMAATSAKIDRLSRARRIELRKELFNRDGSDCWYCGELMPTKPIDVDSPDFPTIEHLVPVSEGGGNAAANLVLAHASCNQLADNAPLAEKIELRAGFHARHKATPPWQTVRAA